MCLDGNAQFGSFCGFCSVESECIAQVLESVVGAVGQQMFGTAYGVYECIVVDKALFFKHSQVKCDIVGDKIVFGPVELFDFVSEFCFGVRGFVLNNIGGDVVHFHCFNADGDFRGAEFVKNFYVLF